MLGASPESPRMFDNDVIDFFSRVPAWVVPAIYVPMAIATLSASVGQGVRLHWLAIQVSSGWLAWTLMEYALHRTVFHWQPDTSWGARFHFLVHGVHHEWFRDRYRLVMPPMVSLVVSILLHGLLHSLAVAGSEIVAPTWNTGVFAGLVLGYMFYDLTHYYIHHTQPKTWIGRALRAHHNKHHHNPRYKDLKFGVSTTLWDHVFGTYEVTDPSEVA